MNSTKTARYHDATNDMLYLIFFMVFLTQMQTHLKPNPLGAVAIHRVAMRQNDLANIAQTDLKALSVKVEQQKRQQPET